jgi:hypothetical protein
MELLRFHGLLMDVHLTSMMEIKSHGTMEVSRTSNERPSDFDDRSKISWSYGGFIDV